MTTWNLQINGQVGLGTPFNKSGLTFNHLTTQFGGIYTPVWILQTSN